MSEEGIALSAALEGLRSDLEAAWKKGQGRVVQFGIPEVTLTVQVVGSHEKDGSGKIRWWLIEAGGGMKATAETTQTLTLTLSPTLNEPGEPPVPLKVKDAQSQPEG